MSRHDLYTRYRSRWIPAFAGMTSTFIFCFIFLLSFPASAFDVQEVTSKKGISAWLVQDDRLPIVSMDFMWRGGVEQDAREKQGLAALTMALLTEGAGKYDAEAFQRILADHSIDMAFEAGRDSLSGGVKFLKEDEGVASDLLRLALTKPRFETDAFERARNQQKASVGFSLGDAEWQGRYALFQKIFSDHPYSYRAHGSLKTLDALSVADGRTFKEAHLARDNLVVAVAGDIDAAHLALLLDKVFGDLPERAALMPVPEVQKLATPVSILVSRQGTQASLLFAVPAPKRDDPDWYPVIVANYILGGGGFESRLMEALREKGGMTYGVRTSVAAMDRASLLIGNLAVENGRAGEAMDLVRETISTLREKGATESEVEAAKNYLISSAPLGMTSTSAVSAALAHWRFWGYSPRYFEEYAAQIKKVSVGDVQRVLNKWVDERSMSFSAVGKPEGLGATLAVEETRE